MAYIGLDKDSGYDDARATPATREAAEAALREAVSGESAENAAVEKAKSVEDDMPFNLGDAIEKAVTEADAKGLKPDDPEFAEILQRVFEEANKDSDVKVTFLGVHRLDKPMPEHIKKALEESGAKVLPPVFLGGAGKSDVPTEFLDDLIKASIASSGLPPFMDPPGIKSASFPLPTFDFDLDSTTLYSPLGGPLSGPDILGGPYTNKTIGSGAGPSVEDLMKAVFGFDDQDEQDFETERREVVQDLANAATDVLDLFHQDEEAGRNFAEALASISRLADSTYGD